MSLSLKTIQHLQEAIADTCGVQIFTERRNYKVHSINAADCTLDEITFMVNADKAVTLSQAHVVGCDIQS